MKKKDKKKGLMNRCVNDFYIISFVVIQVDRKIAFCIDMY